MTGEPDDPIQPPAHGLLPRPCQLVTVTVTDHHERHPGRPGRHQFGHPVKGRQILLRSDPGHGPHQEPAVGHPQLFPQDRVALAGAPGGDIDPVVQNRHMPLA